MRTTGTLAASLVLWTLALLHLRAALGLQVWKHQGARLEVVLAPGTPEGRLRPLLETLPGLESLTYWPAETVARWIAQRDTLLERGIQTVGPEVVPPVWTAHLKAEWNTPAYRQRIRRLLQRPEVAGVSWQAPPDQPARFSRFLELLLWITGGVLIGAAVVTALEGLAPLGFAEVLSWGLWMAALPPGLLLLLDQGAHVFPGEGWWLLYLLVPGLMVFLVIPLALGEDGGPGPRNPEET